MDLLSDVQVPFSCCRMQNVFFRERDDCCHISSDETKRVSTFVSPLVGNKIHQNDQNMKWLFHFFFSVECRLFLEFFVWKQTNICVLFQSNFIKDT